MTNKVKKTILRIALWALLIFLMLLIFHFSSQPAIESQKTSNGLMYKLIKILPDFLENRFILALNEEILSKIIRKTAHFVLFLSLGSVSYSLCVSYFPEKLRILTLISWAFSIVYAITDEIHQRLIPGRSGQISDVLLDSSGALVGILLLYFIIYYYRKIKISKN